MRRRLYEPEHEQYRSTVREFVEREVVPHQARWESERMVDRPTWLAAGRQGVIGLAVPEEYGGSGVDDIRYRSVVIEELARVGAASLNSGFGVQDDITLPYLMDLATPEQKKRWLPGLAAGELIGAIAMTEPGAGGDLQGIRTTAVRDGSDWVLNGAKTFITNGITSDLATAEAQRRIVDRCVQLFGGCGYMMEHPVSRACVDARVQTIYGGTSEVMRAIIARDLTGLR